MSDPLHLAWVALRKCSTIHDCVSPERPLEQCWRCSPNPITAALIRRLLCSMSSSTCRWDLKQGKMWQTGQTSPPVSLLGFCWFPAKTLHPLRLVFPMQDRSSLGKFVLNLIAASTERKAINLGDVLYHCTVIISVFNYLCTLGMTVNLSVNHCWPYPGISDTAEPFSVAPYGAGREPEPHGLPDIEGSRTGRPNIFLFKREHWWNPQQSNCFRAARHKWKTKLSCSE